jgi:uncharacterized surface protein with fasciclin (FAS1) repeats
MAHRLRGHHSNSKNQNPTIMKNPTNTQWACLLAPIFIAVPATMAQKALADPAPAEEAQVVKPGSLTKIIADSTSFSLFTKALVATGLATTLGADGTYTVFAPTDEAFSRLPEGALAKLMLPENKEKLRSLLLYHVIAGRMFAVDFKDGEVKTMNGEKLKIDVDGKDIKIGDAKTFSTDVLAGNGILHTIGQVQVPKSLDGFAGLGD